MLTKINQNFEPDWIWWKHGVIYHIYPRSFFDSNGDGIGDIQGIINKLGYLSDLGVDAMWLSPIYSSPNFDFGYDVSDYRGINPEYGTMDDFKQLLEESHARGIRVIMDMVLNHTSIRHPWFEESRGSRTNPKRDWYIWKDGSGKKAPNNWRATIGGSAWEYDIQTGQFYLHSFFREQPDLNWRNPEVAKSVFEELKYWLDLGVDGFRLDAINLIVKDKKFRNNPFLWGIPLFQKHIYVRNRPKSIRIVGKLRKLLDAYPQRVAVGEIYSLPPGNPENAARYLNGGENGIHLAFDFSLIFSAWNARNYYRCITEWYNRIPEFGWPCNVLSNHDLFRHIDRYRWRRYQNEKAKVAAFLLLTMKGTPFLYYGEEIGMKNGKLSRKFIRDPLGKKYWPLFKGRDNARTPMQWSSSDHAGFTDGIPWLPLNVYYRSNNVEQQINDPDSLLNLYRSLIHFRRYNYTLQMGEWIPLSDGKNGIIAYLRETVDQRLLIVLNFTRTQKSIQFQNLTYGKVIISTTCLPGEIRFLRYCQLHPFEATLIETNLNSHL